MGVRGPVRCSIAGVLALAFACSTEYDRPEGSRTPPASTGGVGTGGSGSGGFPVVGTGGTTSTGGRPPGEPPGDEVLTLVNGVVDAERVLLCLTSGPGADQAAFGSPFPEGGLPYGASLVITDLAALGIEQGQAVAPLVIAGELSLLDGMECDDAVAMALAEQAAAPTSVPSSAGGAGGGAGGALEPGELPAGENAGTAGEGEGGGGGMEELLPPAPRLRVSPLPIIPPGSLSAGRSSLLVATGCMGGPAFAAKQAPLACGSVYTPERPTLSALLVRLSRRSAFGKLGVQAVNASVASAQLEFLSAPLTPASELPFTFASRVGYGAIAPDPPRLDFPASTYGAGSSLWGVRVTEGGAELYSEAWSELLERSQIEIEDGRGYTLVYVGPEVGVPASDFWNEPRVVVISNDPTRAQ